MTVKALNTAIATERFTLEPLGRWRALQASYHWTNDAEIIRNYSGSAAPRSRWRWYRQMVRPNKRTKFAHAIIPHGQKEPIGLHFVHIRPYRSAYLGIALHDRSWWGKDAAFEVRKCMINHFLQNAPVDRFCGYVNARNFASVFNYRKLGFTHVGTLHRVTADPVSGDVHDMLIFEMFRKDWEARETVAHG